MADLAARIEEAEAKKDALVVVKVVRDGAVVDVDTVEPPAPIADVLTSFNGTRIHNEAGNRVVTSPLQAGIYKLQEKSDPVAAAASRHTLDLQLQQLNKFIQEVQEPEVANALKDLKPGAVISLKNDAKWLGLDTVASSDLYVRQAIPELLAAGKVHKRSRQWDDDTGTIFYTGSPGTGKTHVGAALCGIFINEGRPVLLELRKSQVAIATAPQESTAEFFWIQKQGAERVTREQGRSLLNAALYSDTIKSPAYLTDGGPRSLDDRDYNGPSYVFTSFQRHIRHQQSKGNKIVFLYMPLCSKEEILSMRDQLPQFQKLDRGLVSAWFDVAGGIPRTCLQKVANNLETIAEFLQRVSSELQTATFDELLSDLANIDQDGFSQRCDAIFHWRVAVDSNAAPPGPTSPQDPQMRQYSKKSLQFASPRVLSIALRNLKSKQLLRLALQCVGGRGDLVVQAEYWVEVIMHQIFAEGGQFEAYLLGARPALKKKFNLQLQKASSVGYWCTIQEAKTKLSVNLSSFLMPISTNEPVVDAMRSPALLIQSTKAKRHGIARDGATDLASTLQSHSEFDASLKFLRRSMQGLPSNFVLSKPVLAFAVPPQIFERGFKQEQRYFQGKAAKVPQSPLFHQIVVKLPLDKMLAEFQPSVNAASLQAAVQALDEARTIFANGIDAEIAATRLSGTGLGSSREGP